MFFLGQRKKSEEKKPNHLEPAMLEQIRTHFEKIRHPVELIASLGGKPKAEEIHDFLEEIAGLSDKISITSKPDSERRTPSFSVTRKGEDARMHFAGLPVGHELTSLILSILHAGGHPPKAEQALIERIRHLEGDFHFETYITLSCHNCPDVVQALNLMAAVNPRIQHTMIDGKLFLDEIERYKIDAVPTVLLNGKQLFRGRKELEELVDLIAATSN